jgi:hypothetical protein
MAIVVTLVGALLFGPACLAFLLWLGHLEETLPRDVVRAQRRPEPPPILAIPVRRPQTEPVATQVPAQRIAPAAELSGTESIATT